MQRYAPMCSHFPPPRLQRLTDAEQLGRFLNALEKLLSRKPSRAAVRFGPAAMGRVLCAIGDLLNRATDDATGDLNVRLDRNRPCVALA